MRLTTRPSVRGGALGKLIVFMAVVGATATLGWMLLLPVGIERVLVSRSGFATDIGRLAVNPFSGRFSGGEVAIDNPGIWGGGPFVRLAQFSGRLEPLSATREELVLDELTVEIDHLVVIIAPDGSTNAQAFGEGFALSLPPEVGPVSRRAVAGFPGLGEGPQSVLVRRLHLKVGLVEVLQPGHATLERLAEQLEFEGDYQNVRRWEDLLSTELVTRLAKSPALWRALLASDAISGDEAGGNALQRLLQKAGGALNSFFRTLEQ